MPDYQVRGVDEIDRNPLTAYLPLPPETDDDAWLELALRPKFDTSERDLPASLRRILIDRLRHFFIPTSAADRQALISIRTQIFNGYIPRNPLTTEGQALLYGGTVADSCRPTIIMIAGLSGMGKSALISRTMASFRHQVFRHREFCGMSFPETQLLWLRRNVPERCTVKTLCSTFGDHADHVLGGSLYGGVFGMIRGANRTTYLAEVRKIIASHHVGCLVLDEFQNLSLLGIGAKEIVAFLVNLRDELGLPIVVVGTYKALRLLEDDMSTARRLAEGGFFDLERAMQSDDPSWIDLCQIAWEYQWVRDPISFSEEASAALYEASQGVRGIMLSTFANAQLAAIENGSESVDAKLILEVHKTRMKPLHAALRILKSGDPRLLDKYDDMYVNLWPTENSGRPAEPDTSSSAEATEDSSVPNAEASDSGRTERTAELEAGPSRKRPRKAESPLSEEQIKRLVTAESVADLVGLLEKT